MENINPNMYLPSYNESQISQTSQKKANANEKSKNDKPPKYSPSIIYQNNIVHPYIMNQPSNIVTINVTETVVLSNGIIFNCISSRRNNGINLQSRRPSECFIYKLCKCYKKQSIDSRCCGLCYYLCPLTPEDREYNNKHYNICNVCPAGLDDYINSCYCKTTDSPNSPDDCLCTTFCCPVKFPLFITCFLGSIFNSYVNCLCNTNKNYIF
jgi:hypothetical protein